MVKKPNYDLQIESLRRTRRYEALIKRPPQIDEILGRKKDVEILGVYSVHPKSNRLRPTSIPTNRGKRVIVEDGACPKEFETNIICDDLRYIGDSEYKTWVPRFKFFVGQIVSFWTKDVQYDFQIYPTDDPRYGEFVLVNRSAVSSSPGERARVRKTSSI